MFDKIHQKFCHNRLYLNILERLVHIPCCIFVYSVMAIDFVFDKLNIDSDVFGNNKNNNN